MIHPHPLILLIFWPPSTTLKFFLSRLDQDLTPKDFSKPVNRVDETALQDIISFIVVLPFQLQTVYLILEAMIDSVYSRRAF